MFTKEEINKEAHYLAFKYASTIYQYIRLRRAFSNAMINVLKKNSDKK
jgi:hypothetical protein